MNIIKKLLISLIAPAAIIITVGFIVGIGIGLFAIGYSAAGFVLSILK